MPGMITVDIPSTFQTVLLLGAADKLRFGTDIPEVSQNGEAKYTVDLAVTFRPENGMKASSEVISATLTGGDRNAILAIPPGSLVEVTGLRCGVSAPEKRDDGRVRGGKLYWSLSGIVPVNARQLATAGKPE